MLARRDDHDRRLPRREAYRPLRAAHYTAQPLRTRWTRIRRGVGSCPSLYAGRVQEIGIGVARVTSASPRENSLIVFLEFHGLRYPRTQSTRTRASGSPCQPLEPSRCGSKLSEMLPSQVEWRCQFGDILLAGLRPTRARTLSICSRRRSAFWREHCQWPQRTPHWWPCRYPPVARCVPIGGQRKSPPRG
jgi:hypothetical protein